MLEWCPDIDAMIGVFDRDRIVEAVTGSAGSAAATFVGSCGRAAGLFEHRRQRDHRRTSTARSPAKGYFESDAARLRLTPRHYAYLRISEGCNQNCAFCTIPSIRGKMRIQAC